MKLLINGQVEAKSQKGAQLSEKKIYDLVNEQRKVFQTSKITPV